MMVPRKSIRPQRTTPWLVRVGRALARWNDRHAPTPRWTSGRWCTLDLLARWMYVWWDL